MDGLSQQIPKADRAEVQFDATVPTVADRALQRSTAEVLSAIYEQDFLPCSFGGRPKLSKGAIAPTGIPKRSGLLGG